MPGASETKNDYDLQEAWSRVCQDFAKTTKVDLTAAPKYSVDEVLEQIRTRQEEDNEKGAKYREVKDFVNKTMTFIGLLGGIVAQGASMVFAPSSLCFNALSYLVNTGAKYKKIFTGLSELFRKICDVLDRLKIYMELSKEAVHIALRKILNEQLLCFVDICALSIKVLQGHRVLLALKVFAFSGDEGVSGQLARLETLVEREAQMRATLGFASQKASEQRLVESLEKTKTIDTAVNKLLDADRKRDAYVQAAQTLDELDIFLDKPSEHWARTQAKFKKITSQRILGTGEWISDHPLYKSWTTMEDESKSCTILGIDGGEGCGKSFLLSSILQDLNGMHSKNGGASIHSVAYYSFDQPSEGNSLAQAMKVLAWQIAKSNIVYCKDLSTIEMSGGNDIRMLWSSLFERSYQSDLRFFLLLDGLEHLTKDELSDFFDLLVVLCADSEEWGKFKLHILLSGREEAIGRVSPLFEPSVIHAARQNGEDLQKFIEHRVNRMESLSGSSEEIVAIRGQVLEKLKASTKGDFVAAGLLLNEISKKQRPSEIREILAHSGRNREEIIGKKIQQLNSNLSENDINDLNEILTWLIFAEEPLILAELEEVLFHKNGERSLKPLSKSIIDQYSSLIFIEGKPKTAGGEYPLDSRVLLVSDSIKDIVMRTKNRKVDGEGKIENEVKAVNESEIRIVRRFLESVCDASLFDRFGFSGFFEEKLGKSSAKLFVDKERAHFDILKICLAVICSTESSSPKGYAMKDYAIKFLPYHLERVDLSLVHPNDKADLGPNLVALFYDAAVINDWWMTESFAVTRQREDWVYNDTHTELVMKWLHDSAVTRNLGDEQLRWVRSLVSKSEPESDILERIAQTMAKHWLEKNEQVYIKYWYFPLVYGFFTKIENRKDPATARPIRDLEDDELEPSHILATAKWATRKFHGRDSLGPQEIYSVGSTLAVFGKHDESIAHLTMAIPLISDSWRVEWDLAMAYAGRKEYAQAVELIEDLIKRMEASDMPPEERAANRYIHLLKSDLATCYEESGQDDRALKVYESLVEDSPGEYQSVCNLLEVLSRTKDHEGVLRFLQSLKDSTDEKSGLDRRTLSLLEMSTNETFHGILLAMGSNGPLFDVVRTAYPAAIAAADTQWIKACNEIHEGNDEDKERKITYLKCRKLALMSWQSAHRYQNASTNMNDRRQAIEEWECILDMDFLSRYYFFIDVEWVRSKTRERLTKAYLAEARRDQERSSSYLDKLEQFTKVNMSKDLTDGLKREAACLLARYHALQGNKGKAKSILSPYLKVDLDILCDDDPLNDWEGYQCLATHFWAIEEMDSVIAAWSLITPHPEYTGSNAGKLKGPVYVPCEGSCETRWTYADNFYVCATCKDRQYDRACLDQLRSGALEVAGCDKDHDMVHIPEYDPVERATVGEGNVRVGGEIMSVQSWIRLIRQDWGIED